MMMMMRAALSTFAACLLLVPLGAAPASANPCVPTDEVCNGVDDDCDGNVDQSCTWLGLNQTNGMVENLHLGAQCVVGVGACESDPGTVVCDPGATCSDPALPNPGTGAVCDATPKAAGTEGPYPDATCFDGIDNDCDGKTDAADPACTHAEVCDGFDNDGDGVIDNGLHLGESCSVGVGVCAATGVKVCNGSGGVTCSAVAGTGSPENDPESPACSDGLDNDCDGKIDIQDPGCQTPEKCDGKDNDGDLVVDNGFANLGQSCTAGVGACQRTGVFVCSPDGSTTVCSAVAGAPSPETLGPPCSDGIDNDCDGKTDAADSTCGPTAAGLQVSCKIPYTNGKPGGDCTGRHKLSFSSNDPNATVTADLLALDAQGNVLNSASIKNGADLHLASRIKPKDFKFQKNGSTFDDFAPVPLVRVRADNGLNKVEAYCSPIPYLQMIQPKNSVVPASQTNTTPVEVAMTLVDPKRLTILIDGVNLLNALGVNSNVFPNDNSPISGTVTIGGQSVQITNLVVRSAPVDQLSSNTLTFEMSNLGCGGHKVVVSGFVRPNSFPNPNTLDCDIDDLNDNGVSMTFTIDITSPTPQQVTAGGTTHVTGKVCHGREITSADVNGFPIPTGGQMTTGGSATTAATVMLPIDVMVPETDLLTEIQTGVPQTGTFDPGSNRLIAKASDSDGNTTFKNLFFAVGPVQTPPAVGSMIEPVALAAAQAVMPRTGPPGSIDPAFTLGLSAEALNTFFAEKCKSVRDQVAAAVTGAVANFSVTKPVDALCDPDVQSMAYGPITVDPTQLTCSVVPSTGKITVTMNIPDVHFTVYSHGYCEDDFLGVCTESLNVKIFTPITLSGMSVTFDVTEDNIRDNSDVTPVFDPGTLTKGTPDNQSDVGCIVGFFLDVFDVIAEIFTFGAYDPGPAAEAPVVTTDLKEKLGLIKGDPFKLNVVRFKGGNLPAFMMTSGFGFSDVHIDSNGMNVSVFGLFAPTMIDPEVAVTPGTPLTPAPVPLVPISGAGGVTIGISDDVFNQLFNGMTQTGKLKTLVDDETKTLGQYMPPNCSVISSPEGQGVCEGIKAAGNPAGGTLAYCASKFPVLTPDTNLAARLTCDAFKALFEARSVPASTKIDLRGRVDNPPKLEIHDNPATDGVVETVLRFSQLSIAFLADRDGTTGFSGSLNAAPSCLAPTTATTSDCFLFEGCANIDVNLNMKLVVADGKSAIKPDVGTVDPHITWGALCSGSGAPGNDEKMVQQAAMSATGNALETAAASNVPPLEGEGLTFGGVVNFVNPKLIAIDNEPNTDFGDYLAITGDLAPMP
jgi:hypothetical protein